MSTWVHANPAPLPPAPTHFFFFFGKVSSLARLHFNFILARTERASMWPAVLSATRTDIVGLQIPWVAFRRFFTPKIKYWRASNGPSNSSRQSLGCDVAYCKVPRITNQATLTKFGAPSVGPLHFPCRYDVLSNYCEIRPSKLFKTKDRIDCRPMSICLFH